MGTGFLWRNTQASECHPASKLSLMRRLALLCVFAFACASEDAVPTNTMLWRVEGWERPSGDGRQEVRVSRGTIIAFRASGEYVEVHCSLIEQPDGSVLIQSGRPCVSAVGRWSEEDGALTVTREKASAAALCSVPSLEFRVTGNSVRGDVVGAGEAAYSPVTRFVAPEFETHVQKARAGTECRAAER